MKVLKIGETYWIFDGHMQPFEAVLTEIVNEGRTAVFGGLDRKTSSVYKSKEVALKKMKY